jgi:hypothetical protein
VTIRPGEGLHLPSGNKPLTLEEAMNQRASGNSNGGTPSSDTTAPFDRGAAAGALRGVNYQACAKPDGPTGSGHVTVTFSPDGSVSSAVLDQGSFPGTAVGNCIAGRFRGAAHIPPFSGSPTKVGKSFSINGPAESSPVKEAPF